MWIIPNTLPLFSAFAQECVESKEDLTELLLNLDGSSPELSLMWKSKPSSLKTWFNRWKKVYWLRHLFGQTLKRSQQKVFTERYTGSLEDIHVSQSVNLENYREGMMKDIYGLVSGGATLDHWRI